ncbi:unnamed protein product, partial [Chrysoparadoxa australica]
EIEALKKGKPSRASDTRRIKQLEAQLEQLEESLQKRHPDSVANLIRAAQPVQSEEQLHERELEKLRSESELRLRA